VVFKRQRVKYKPTCTSDRFMPSLFGLEQFNVLILHTVMCDWSEIRAAEEYTIASCTT